MSRNPHDEVLLKPELLLLPEAGNMIQIITVVAAVCLFIFACAKFLGHNRKVSCHYCVCDNNSSLINNISHRICMCMIFLHTKCHTPSCSGALVINVEPKGKIKFNLVVMLLFYIPTKALPQ
jgi:hypothetical protein